MRNDRYNRIYKRYYYWNNIKFNGSGGSILTIPVLVYILTIEPILATTYSLFIVGVTAFFGAIKNIKKGNVDFKIGLIFTFPSLLSIYFTRRLFYLRFLKKLK